jgi:hypothetical protein
MKNVSKIHKKIIEQIAIGENKPQKILKEG